MDYFIEKNKNSVLRDDALICSSLSLCIKSHGVAHFQVAEISNKLGVVCCQSGELKCAFDMLQKSFKIQKGLLLHGLYNV